MGKTYKDHRGHTPKDIIRTPKVGIDGHLYDGEYDEAWTPEAKRTAKKMARRARRRSMEIGDE